MYTGAMRFSTTMYSLLLALPGGFFANGFGFLPEATAAQVVEVDEGTFIVELDGLAVGTERFRIRRSGFAGLGCTPDVGHRLRPARSRRGTFGA